MSYQVLPLLAVAILSASVIPSSCFLPHTAIRRDVNRQDAIRISRISQRSSVTGSPITSPQWILSSQRNEPPSDFSNAQKIESVKSGAVGLISAGIALTPFSALHNIGFPSDFVQNEIGQWEFDTDMGSLEGALFAIVYRYCIRKDDNPMLNQGVIGAFVLVRTLSKIQVPSYCSAIPLKCGAPIGYFDWAMLGQVAWGGLESAALFGAAAAAMDYCFRRNIISKFG